MTSWAMPPASRPMESILWAWRNSSSSLFLPVMGYEYSTGEWRVPPGVTGSRFKVVERKENHAVIEAEVDLINASGLGVSTIFRRDVTVKTTKEFLSVKTIETIQYIGTRSLSNEQCLLAPWSLCQFDCGDGTEVVFPGINSSEIWDMYEPSDSHRYLTNGLWHIVADGSLRYQVGLSDKIPWIKLYLPHQKMEITRIAERLTADQKYIDIVDADPAKSPSDKGVCYSVYCDTDKFMEIEAAGGCPDILKPGSKLSLEIITEYRGT